MAVATEKLTLEEFRQKYANEKPYFEYWDGQAVQKSLPTLLHSKLQSLVKDMLVEMGFDANVELTLRISDRWEPTPDVVASIDPLTEPYPTHAVDVAIEVLSPGDQFSLVQEKCEGLDKLGIRNIIVMDPVRQRAWVWDREIKSLLAAPSEHQLVGDKTLMFENVWNRFKQMIPDK
jgi:Uma2 family endonuclease